MFFIVFALCTVKIFKRWPQLIIDHLHNENDDTFNCYITKLLGFSNELKGITIYGTDKDSLLVERSIVNTQDRF